MIDDDRFDQLECERDGDAVRATIRSESKLNALNQGLAEELHAFAIACTEDETLRCVTLVGSGEAFCAGADIASWRGDERDGAAVRKLATTLHDAILEFHAMDAPLVVGVNGVAAGAGFSLSLSGDVVLCHEDARLEYAYSRLGLTGDGGSTFYLPRIVGVRRAREIALLDEPIAPERAVELGLATEVVPGESFEERLEDISSRLAIGPTRTYGATKRLLNRSLERGLADQLAAETDAIATATHGEDYRRGYEAFFAGEEPEFVGE